MTEKVYALGFFDGVHIAHADLLRKTVSIAVEKGLTPAVLTFDRQPGNVPLLTTTEERIRIIHDEFGIHDVTILPFTDELRNTPWKDFLENILIKDLSAAYFVTGYDYRFGSNREGDASLLLHECARRGIGCAVIDKVVSDGVVVSSTAIRSMVAAGEMTCAAAFLGRNFAYTGVIAHGAHRGTEFGAPTINLAIGDDLVRAKFGVYASKTVLDGVAYPSVTNIGVRPTVVETDIPNAETNILGFSADVYGKKVRVELVNFLRPEQKFNNTAALMAQIEADKIRAKEILAQ